MGSVVVAIKGCWAVDLINPAHYERHRWRILGGHLSNLLVGEWHRYFHSLTSPRNANVSSDMYEWGRRLRERVMSRCGAQNVENLATHHSHVFPFPTQPLPSVTHRHLVAIPLLLVSCRLRHSPAYPMQQPQIPTYLQSNTSTRNGRRSTSSSAI